MTMETLPLVVVLLAVVGAGLAGLAWWRGWPVKAALGIAIGVGLSVALAIATTLRRPRRPDKRPGVADALDELETKRVEEVETRDAELAARVDDALQEPDPRDALLAETRRRRQR